VLGGVLLENHAMNVVLETLSAGDFYSEANGKIFDVMIELFRRGQPIDHVTLTRSRREAGCDRRRRVLAVAQQHDS
jgi:replicative DNA helicase